MRQFTAIVEHCSETHLFVGYVPGFPGAHSQGETLDELSRNLQEVVSMLLVAEIRQRGSHRQFRHPDGRCTTVPFHQGRDISPILLRQIVKDIDMTMDEFLLNRK